MLLPEYWLTLPAQAGGSVSPDRQTPPLVLLHGFLGSAADWAELMPELSNPIDQINQINQITCLAPDLPGHGLNPQTACDFAAMADQIWQDLDAAGIEK